VTLPQPRCEPLDACPACGSAGSRERFLSSDLLMGVPGKYRYVECAACRTVYQDPQVREADLGLCYPSGYFTHGGTPWVPTPAPAASLRDRLRRAIRAAADGAADDTLSLPVRAAGRLLALHPGLRRRARLGLVDGLSAPLERVGRCLEVGPGQGIDLFCLRTLGWQACGLEVDPRAAEQARATSGCEVRVGTLESTDYPRASFDVVYMSHVFEHLARPAPALRRCLELLRPGGGLVLVYPNPRSLTARVFGASSCVFESPRHLVLPPPRAVRQLLRSAGFDGVSAHTTARHAAVQLAACRALRSGAGWDWSRPSRPRPADRLFALAEAALIAAGLVVGEEIVVRARRPSAG
jgi:SAM-dependent methyltransferase